MSYFPDRLLARAALGTLVLCACAHSSPHARSWRSLAIGDAGVAIVDDGEAIHTNPAGLSQLGSKGSFHPLDTLGYKRDRFDLWLLGLGVDPSPEKLLKLYDYYDNYSPVIQKAKSDPKSALQNQPMLDDLYQFDRLPIPLRTNIDVLLAFHGYAAALWSQDDVTALMDHGALTPKAQIGLASTTGLELATSRSFIDDRLSLGITYRIVSTSSESKEYDVTELQKEGQSGAEDLLRSSASNLRRSEDWGHGMDFGFLWFQTPGLRYGGSVQNLGMKLGHRFVTPIANLGMAWAPWILQSNKLWSRKANIALSVNDIFNDTLGFKPLSKIGMGAEYEMTFIPHVLVGRLSGGFMGGYPTGGVSGTLFSFLRGDFITYAEEAGHFTGQMENRYWMARVGIGL